MIFSAVSFLAASPPNTNANINEKNWRVSDQKFYISNLDNIKREFNWEPEMRINEKIYEYLNWIESNQILTNDKKKSL